MARKSREKQDHVQLDNSEQNEIFLSDSKPEKLVEEEEFDEETRCGFWIFQGKWMQKLASKKVFLVFHAVSGMMYSASFFYYSGTVTTLEKHYKFSSTQIAYIGSLYDIVGMVVSAILPYYCSKGRFPRWLGFSILCYGVSCLIYTLPYIFYGAGEDALSLTEEFGHSFNSNTTLEIIQLGKMKDLCYANSENFGNSQ